MVKSNILTLTVTAPPVPPGLPPDVKITKVSIYIASYLPQAQAGCFVDVDVSISLSRALKPGEPNYLTVEIYHNDTLVKRVYQQFPYDTTSFSFALYTAQLVEGLNKIYFKVDGVESNILTITALPSPPVTVLKPTISARYYESKPGYWIIAISGKVSYSGEIDPNVYDGVFIMLKYLVNDVDMTEVWGLGANVRQVWIGFPAKDKDYYLAFETPSGRTYKIQVIAYTLKSQSASDIVYVGG